MNMEKNMRFNYGATAYQFMLHQYRMRSEIFFRAIDLEGFIKSFIYHSGFHGCNFFDDNSEDLSYIEAARHIIGLYASYTKDNYGHTFCYFNRNGLERMRSEYENMSDDYRKEIYSFEEMYVREIFDTKETYRQIENNYEMTTEQLNAEEDFVRSA